MIRVLIVDDDAAVRSVMAELLSLYDLEVSVASNGDDALEQVRRSRFSVIVMDINMAVSDGLTTCRRLRNTGNTTPVIALTGKPGSPEAQELRDSYGVPVLVKPPDVDELVAQIRRIHEAGPTATE